MNAPPSTSPKILIIEPDRESSSVLRDYALRGFDDASVQSTTSALSDVASDKARLAAFDVVVSSCDFSRDGSTANPVLAAVRTISADPSAPAVILVTHGGSEYTAVQAIKAGAFDNIPRNLLGRERLLDSVRAAWNTRMPVQQSATQEAAFFGYTLRRCIARRPDVAVYVAHSAERNEPAVLKVMQRGRGSLLRDPALGRFIDEFMLLYDIHDPAVAEIYGFHVTNRCCYIAMEYFPSGHLGQKLQTATEPDEALTITAGVADALAIIHAAGVVHRDLKPGNIMVRDDGSFALIDFGIAQSRSVEPSDSGPIAGTPYYMSPEQVRGQPTDERSDLYALGIILFQMLTGEKPYRGDSAQAILAQHCYAPVPSLPPELSPLQPLIERLLAKDAAQRIPSAREAGEAVELARFALRRTAVAEAKQA